MVSGVQFYVQVRCLVDVPGDKLPSITTGALQAYLLEVVAPQVYYHFPLLFCFGGKGAHSLCSFE